MGRANKDIFREVPRGGLFILMKTLLNKSNDILEGGKNGRKKFKI